MNTAKGFRMFALIAMASAFALTARAQSTSSTPPPPSSATTSPTSGQTNRSDLTGQQIKQNQQDRIAQGMKSGSLTPEEASKLEQQEHNMGKTLNAERAANGGKLTPAEQQAERQRAKQMSQNVRQAKHNNKGQ